MCLGGGEREGERQAQEKREGENREKEMENGERQKRERSICMCVRAVHVCEK